MKALFVLIVSSAIACAAQTDEFIAAAKSKHGGLGEKAARFLVENMPEDDKESLSAEFLNENLDLAFKARETFPWAKDVPEDIFLNDVLPYAVFDEPRDPWRADFFEKAAPLVNDAASAAEAAQILNREFFKLINTHYHTKRKRPNQSPQESIEQGKATCTGLSIILVDACRAVGIPARAVGTPLWSDDSGNHTWVEIWDKEWQFTGADEYSEKGLNHGWFTNAASKADASDPLHTIYATTWRKTELRFPMVWSNGSHVAAVDVTARYAKDSENAPTLGIRFFNGEQREVVDGLLLDESGKPLALFTTKAGTSDLNDMPQISVEAGKKYRLRFFTEDQAWQGELIDGVKTFDAHKSELKSLPLAEALHITRETAPELIRLAYHQILDEQKEARSQEITSSLTIGDHTLKWLEKTFGEAPEGGHSLWISMHGGGGAPPAVNDQQWRNQSVLYQPKEGIYIAPRAPTDTWDLWHQEHIDPLFSRLIENMIAFRNVNPDKVYLLGYSAGGDGVWQLAPRMADRFAAAAMMAGHPGDASLLSLRNLPFAIFMGGADAAYNRNKIAAKKTAALDALRKEDPEGYIHMSRIYEGLPHWMNRKDAEALPWMAKFTRNPWPKKIVWIQDNIIHDRFYWLHLPPGTAKQGDRFDAEIKGQQIILNGPFPEDTRLLLHDTLIDLDQPIQVIENDKAAREFQVSRSLNVIRAALQERLDPASCPTAEIILK
ncbi:MAG: transglutaminase domain-containing protein [Luteolibacter sp.]